MTYFIHIVENIIETNPYYSVCTQIISQFIEKLFIMHGMVDRVREAPAAKESKRD
jgi:hypothetical protein